MKDSALCIVLDTVKGQGVRFFEELEDNHSVKFDDKIDEATDLAISELKAFIEHGRI